MTTTQSRAAVSNPRPSSQWLLTLVGVVLLVVGCLLPWAFVPAILGNVTVLLNPGAMQILMIIVGAIALFFLLLRTGR